MNAPRMCAPFTSPCRVLAPPAACRRRVVAARPRAPTTPSLRPLPPTPARHTSLVVVSSTADEHDHVPTYAAFTSAAEARMHNLTRALLGLEHKTSAFNRVAPRYIDLREVRGAQPPDAVLGVCARGDAACPGHRLPLHSASEAVACCIECGAILANTHCSVEARRAAGAVEGKPTPRRVASQIHVPWPIRPAPRRPFETLFRFF